MKYKCKRCPYFEDNHVIPIINPNHPIYYEDVDFCGISEEYELTIEYLEIKCPLKFNELSNDFNLINTIEIQDFILLHDDLFDYLSQIKLLLQKYFPEYNYCLEFYSDPELQSLNQLVIYINGDESSFDEDWSSLKRMNSEINELDNSVKHLISVDLW